MENIKKKTITSLIWRFFERTGAQGVSFIVSIVLARLLAPEAYGIIALITVITSILQVFVDAGMGSALIQKKDADDVDFSSVFIFNMIMCIVLYFLLFFLAPSISAFYNNESLTPMIRVMGIILIISGLKNVQQAYVSIKLQFKRFFFATLGGTIGAAIVGIFMAYRGFGAWALIAQNLFNTTVDTIILWITVRWRPKRMFSFSRLKKLINYGWKLLAASLINTIYVNLRSLIIGKMYTAEDLAYYNKGGSFPSLVVSNINSSIDSVLLPTLSSFQDDKERIKSITRRSIVISSYIMWPMMIGLVTVAKPLIQFLLTDKWLMAVPFLQIICIQYGLDPFSTANLNAIKAIGRSDILLKMEIFKKILSIIILLSSIKYGVKAIALSGLIYGIIATIINAFPNKKLLNYSYIEQMKDVLPYILLSCIMGAIIFPIELLPIPNIIILLLQVTIGGLVYWGVSAKFKLEPYIYIINVAKELHLIRS